MKKKDTIVAKKYLKRISKRKLEFEIKVRLGIHDFECSPKKITKILGIMPSKTWKKGDIISNTIRKHGSNGWLYFSPCDYYRDSIDKQVDILLDIIYPKKKNFLSLPESCFIELSCVVYSYKERPIICFSAEQVRKLAEIGACIDVDSYDLSK